MPIEINFISISFVCPICDHEFLVPLSDVLDSGNPFCPEDVEHGEALINSDFAIIDVETIFIG